MERRHRWIEGLLKKAMGVVIFIDEAYHLYRPENERGYGREAIEILLQVMENPRDDLVLVLAGYQNRMDTFFESNPAMSSRIAHLTDSPDDSEPELPAIARKMAGLMNHRLDEAALLLMGDDIAARKQQPHFANAHPMRNALDRARLRRANRLCESADGIVHAVALQTITAADIRASRLLPGASSPPNPST